LADIGLEDIKPKSDLTLPGDALTAIVTTFDGLAVSVRMAEVDSKNWGTFEAAYTGDSADQSDTAKAARASVEKINQRVGNWVYWLPSAAFENLTAKLEDVLEAKKDKGS
jgi:hypothetical protein